MTMSCSPLFASEWLHLLDKDFRLVTAVGSESRMVSEILEIDVGVVFSVTRIDDACRRVNLSIICSFEARSDLLDHFTTIRVVC
jgi:hypothetical protein